MPYLLIMAMLPGTLFAEEPKNNANAGLSNIIRLQALTTLIISFDPSLEALRGAIADADFRVATADRGKAPEVRVQYGTVDGWSIPDSYTEHSSEVNNESGSTGSETITTVTPNRDSETVQETVTENGTVVSQSTERTTYGRDVYAGRSSYSVQLRLFPRNPFIGAAARGRETATRDHATLALKTALGRAALSVARDYRDIQFRLAELELMQRSDVLLQTDLSRLDQLNTALGIKSSDYHRKRTEALLHVSSMNALKMRIADATGALKARASLGAYDHISFAGSLAPPTADLQKLDAARLQTLALERNPQLGAVQAAGATLESDISALRAESIPWFSTVSFNYGGDESDTGQTRDEWGVYAGVSLPVEAWFNGKPRAALESRLGSIRRQESLTRRHLELAVKSRIQSLASGQADWTMFASQAAQMERDIRQQIEKIVGNDLSAQETRSALNASLIQIEMQRLKLAYRLSEMLFELCDTIGCDLPLLIETGQGERPYTWRSHVSQSIHE